MGNKISTIFKMGNDAYQKLAVSSDLKPTQVEFSSVSEIYTYLLAT